MPAAMEVVERAFDLGKPLIILMHVPLQTDSLVEKVYNVRGRGYLIGSQDIKPNETTQKFIDMINAEGSPVVAVLDGHVHLSDFSELDNGVKQYTMAPGFEGNALLLKISGN